MHEGGKMKNILGGSNGGVGFPKTSEEHGGNQK
jgi:hypothetical protein